MTNLDVFKNRKINIMGNLKRSAVNILLLDIDGEDYVLFERRAKSLRSQPGDISLPGGRIDDGETPFDTAKRELLEEMGIREEDVDYYGENDIFISPYSSIVHSFIGRVNNPKFNINKDEVDEVVYVPLKFLIENEPELHYMNINPIPDNDFPFDKIVNGKNYKFASGRVPQYFYNYKDVNIWGITARIIKNFIDILVNK